MLMGSFQKTAILAILLCATITSAQFSIPLKKRSITTGSEYEIDHFYTLDLNILPSNDASTENSQQKEQALNSIVDLRSKDLWIAGSTCTNCFMPHHEGRFHCEDPCGKSVPDSPAKTLFGSKIAATEHISMNLNAKLSSIPNIPIKLNNLYNVQSIKETHTLLQEHLYLDQVHAGLGLALDIANDPSNFMHQIYLAAQIKQQTFSLFFNQDIARLLIGKSEIFYGKAETKSISTFDKQSWDILVGPVMNLGSNSPDLSAVQDEVVDKSVNKNLLKASLDSTTKFILTPLVVWNRLNKVLFSHNNCEQDALDNQICDCFGSWPDIQMGLVIDPLQASLENNIQPVTIPKKSYLESISLTRCLLLIKPRVNDATLEYVFGTSFLENYYTVFDYDKSAITLVASHGFVPSATRINYTFLKVFAIVGAVLGIILIGVLFVILKKTHMSENDKFYLKHKDRIEGKPEQSVNYCVVERSPVDLMTSNRFTQSARILESPTRHRNISQSPLKNGYKY